MQGIPPELVSISNPDIKRLWTEFSKLTGSSQGTTLRGLLCLCTKSQLSEISTYIQPLLRIDFISGLPSELCFKILSFLDGSSLCRAAQVSKTWNRMADDDAIWHRMCAQHIGTKCAKCGWGLPLLNRKRKLHTNSMYTSNGHSHHIEKKTRNLTESWASTTKTSQEPLLQDHDSNVKSDGKGSSNAYLRPWKELYSERVFVERNWRKGSYITRHLKGHTDGIMCLQFDDANSLLVTGSFDRTIRIWDVDTAECLSVLVGHAACVRAVQFDNAKLVSGSMDHTLKIWNLRTGACIRTLEGHSDGILCLNFNDQILASGSVDSSIRVWNFSTGKSFVLEGHRDWVNQVEIWDNRLLSCSDDTTVKLWDLETRQCLRTFEGHVGQIQSFAGSISKLLIPNNLSDPLMGKLITASLDSTLKVWDLATARCIQTLFGHVEGVWCVAFDSLRIVSGAQDATIKIWDAESGSCLHTLMGNCGVVNCLCLSDTKIISGNENGEIIIWDFSKLPSNG